ADGALARGALFDRRAPAPGTPVRRRSGTCGGCGTRAVRGDALGAGGRGDWPRLPLRFFSARRAAGGLPRAGAARAPGRRGRGECGAPRRGVLHCFTGNDALADAGLALGLFVSLAGIVTFPKAAALRETARRLPLDPPRGR